MTSIPLQTILPIASPRDYKIYLASWNHLHQPLDVFVRDREEWKEVLLSRGRFGYNKH